LSYNGSLEFNYVSADGTEEPVLMTEVGDVYNNLACPDTGCDITSVEMSTQGFGGIYGAPSTINNYVSNRRLLGIDTHRSMMASNFTYFRSLQAETIESLPNPVYCIKAGEGFLF